MASFPAMHSVSAAMIMVGDVIYGRQGTYNGTWQLLKYPVTVTGVDSVITGVNAAGTAMRLPRGPRSDVLIERI
jgi:hypothetical protein